MAGTPLGGTPLGGTPLGGTPLGGTPLGGTPLGGTPLGGTPLGGTPPGGTPPGGAPHCGFPADLSLDAGVSTEVQQRDKLDRPGGLPPSSKFCVRVTPSKRGSRRKRRQPTGQSRLDKTPAKRHASMTCTQRA